MNSTQLEEILTSNNIPFTAIDHPAVFTCEEAARYTGQGKGMPTKNLFLKAQNADAYFLVVTTEKKRVDLKRLSRDLGVRKLSFATDEELAAELQLAPGAVTLLAVINDSRHVVRLVIDTAVWGDEPLHCHPLVNTRTLLISPKDLERFFSISEHQPLYLKVPERQAN